MSALDLRGTEAAGNIEHRHVADQQGGSGRHCVYTKLVIRETLGADGRTCTLWLDRIDFHGVPFSAWTEVLEAAIDMFTTTHPVVL
jgi:hypothetical protein